MRVEKLIHLSKRIGVVVSAFSVVHPVITYFNAQISKQTLVKIAVMINWKGNGVIGMNAVFC